MLAVLSGPLATGSDTAAGIRFSGGGQAANTAAWLAGQGAAVTLVAAVGDDETGRERVAELTRIGVDCAVERHEGYPTGTVIVLTHDGERTMVSQRGANLRLTAAHVDAALAAAPDAGHLHLSAYTLLDVGSRGAGLRALATARARGLTVSVDAASAAPLRRVGGAFLTWVRDVDLLLVNTDEATVLAGGLDPAAQARALHGGGAPGGGQAGRGRRGLGGARRRGGVRSGAGGGRGGRDRCRGRVRGRAAHRLAGRRRSARRAGPRRRPGRARGDDSGRPPRPLIRAVAGPGGDPPGPVRARRR